MTRAGKFSSWARRISYDKGMLCHFYLTNFEKQYYDNSNFAFMNLASSARGWVVKGTTDLGITGRNGKKSQVPCLNCFEVDDAFFKAFREFEGDANPRFQFGLLLNRRKLKNRFGKEKVIPVSTDPPFSPRPPQNMAHYFDIPGQRRGVLGSFNKCKVVRVVIPHHEELNMPIIELPKGVIFGILVKRGLMGVAKKLLRQKGMYDVAVLELP
jgi:hypothetical protein